MLIHWCLLLKNRITSIYCRCPMLSYDQLNIYGLEIMFVIEKRNNIAIQHYSIYCELKMMFVTEKRNNTTCCMSRKKNRNTHSNLLINDQHTLQILRESHFENLIQNDMSSIDLVNKDIISTERASTCHFSTCITIHLMSTLTNCKVCERCNARKKILTSRKNELFYHLLRRHHKCQSNSIVIIWYINDEGTINGTEFQIER